MPYLFLILALLVNPAEARDYSSGIRQAERSCQIEQSSQLRNRNGTPSCNRVKHLREMQRLQVEADVARQTGQKMPDHTKTDIRIYQGRHW